MKRDEEQTAVLAYVAIIAVTLGMVGGLLLARAWGDVYVQPGVEYTVQWTPGEGVTPDGYRLERKVGDGEYVFYQDTAVAHAVDSLETGQSATYRVRAGVDILGGSRAWSEYSDPSETATAVGSVSKPCGIILTIGE